MHIQCWVLPIQAFLFVVAAGQNIFADAGQDIFVAVGQNILVDAGQIIFVGVGQNIFAVECKNIFVAAGQNIFTLNLIILAKAVDLHAVHRKCLRSIDLAFQKFTPCKNYKNELSAFPIFIMTLKFLA